MSKVHPSSQQPDWTKADSVYVQRVDGQKVSLASICKDKKTVFIFMRRFDCPTCYTYAILFHHLRHVLEKADIKVVFISCAVDLNEVNIFIQSFAYWLASISLDGIKPLPGELYIDLTRESYRFFGIGNTLGKLDYIKLWWSLFLERKFGLFLTTPEEGNKKWKSMSEHHAFLEIMNYVRLRMPLFIKHQGFHKTSIFWQAPGIVVTHNNEVLYKYVLKEQYKAIPTSPQNFLKEAFNISSDNLADFSFKDAMTDFVRALINKADHGSISKPEIILDKKVGFGKDSDVYKSTWLGVPVAIKYFKKSESQLDPAKSAASGINFQAEFKTFSNEVAIMMGLRHPNIISVMGFGVDPPNLFIVMEYMEKGSLFALLDSKENISSEEQIRFAYNIADALSHMHDRKPPILHADLKSLNVLIDKDRNLKVSDFGISRELRQKYKKFDGEDSEETGVSCEGTIQWLPPEAFQRENHQPTKGQDMYAFGVILWEIATRRKPWKSVPRRTIAENVVQGQRPPIVASDKLNPNFEDLLNQCWHQSSALRPSFNTVKKILRKMSSFNKT